MNLINKLTEWVRRGETEATDGRRSILRFFAIALLALLSAPGRLLAIATARKNSTGPRWGMAIDLDTCTGCGACAVACQVENNFPSLEAEGTTITWMNILATNKKDSIEMENVPLPCMHCDNPPCVKVCPVGATYKDDEGFVAQIYDRCIGCRYCMSACPYSVRFYNWSEPQWPEPYLNALNPDVATRPKGVVEKCTFCNHRIRRAREEAQIRGTPLADLEVQRLPACAQACPAAAITFGDLNDPESQVSRHSSSPRVFRLLEHLGTKPKVFYLARDRKKS